MTVTIRAEGVTTALDEMFRAAPGVTAFYVRRAVGDMVGDMWRAMKARHAGTSMAEFNKRALKYAVQPRATGGGRSGTPRVSANDVAQTLALAGKLRLDQIAGWIRSWSQIALLHETGGAIRGKGGKAMLVPTKLGLAEKEALGLDKRRGKKAAKQFTPQGLEARGYKIFPSKDRRYLLAEALDGRVIPAWRLAHAVKMPARLGVMATWADLASKRDYRMQRAADSIAKLIAVGITEVAKRKSP